MDDLLFLAHRIPYPPNKGDKIRSFHLLAYLSRHYRVHLGAFVDQRSDRRWRDTVRHYCASAWLGDLAPWPAKARSLLGLVTGEALTLPYYRRPALSRWVRAQQQRYGIRRVLVFSSAMAQYASGHALDGCRRVIDFVDVDSDKWSQYSRTTRWPMAWIYRREAERLGAFEQRTAARCEASVFVSSSEAALFRERLGQGGDRVHVVTNGVDTAYFACDPARRSPYEGPGQRLVFTGAMDYWANEEGVAWLAHQVLPLVRQTLPNAEFYIVGMNPTAGVRRLATLPGVTVTGTVADVRPYLQYADAVMVPLRIARGIQNKVLEAMAMGRPVITTPQALEGIPAQADHEILVATGTEALAARAVAVLTGDYGPLAHAARVFVERHFAWEASLPKFIDLLEGRL